MSIHDTIAASRDRHAQILSDLRAVDYAPDALKSHEAYLADLRYQLRQATRSLEKIEHVTRVEHKLHAGQRDSTVRRLEKADRGMRGYYAALERENEARGEKEMLETQLGEAVTREQELRTVCSHCESLSAEPECLYKRVFEGPTEEFPEEDAQEEATRAAQRRFGEVNGQLGNVRQAMQCLAKAWLTIKEALLSIHEAIGYCKTNASGCGGIFTDIGQSYSLSRAQQKVVQTQALVSQAIRLDSRIQALPGMHIVRHDMISGIIFDNVEKAGFVLDSAQKELRRIRERIFKEADTPPPYTEQPALFVGE
ncbi:uncharacterized protein BJX67DRAFT_373934 [Aspergillus lucknowensis]|uniref:Uncharacterized protein n=1 Tax=Aspergillus lucknowensis TaxID=176173 RepID=A0ABR4LIM8_9EURO